ncbi:MAG: carboxymuconolactone decarboxylase family protein [Acidimicrobiia bacterium]
MSSTGPRIAPLPTDEWSDEETAALRAVYGDKPADALLSDDPDSQPMPNVLATLMRHPALARPFLKYNHALMTTPTVAPRLRELMVLRVAYRTRSTYEWAQHVRLAPRFEITAEELDAIARGADAGVWSPLETELLRATDQLLDHYRIDDDTWSRLAEHLDEHQLIEVAFIVGTYTCLAMVFNSVGLELDPDLDPSAAPPLPDSDA